MTTTVLLVPGYTNSGPQHWQSLWEREHPEFHRVEQRDWEAPDRVEWVQTLDRAIRTISTPVLLVGHSCGSATIALWAEQHDTRNVVGALLVAPPDCEAKDAIPEITPLAPMPCSKLSFLSILVASSNDPYLSLQRAQEFARWWGSRLEIIEDAGHIDTAAGYGHWVEGQRFLKELLTSSDVC